MVNSVGDRETSVVFYIGIAKELSALKRKMSALPTFNGKKLLSEEFEDHELSVLWGSEVLLPALSRDKGGVQSSSGDVVEGDKDVVEDDVDIAQPLHKWGGKMFSPARGKDISVLKAGKTPQRKSASTKTKKRLEQANPQKRRRTSGKLARTLDLAIDGEKKTWMDEDEVCN